MHLQTKQNPKDSMTEQGIAVSCHNVRFRYFQQNRKNILDGCSMTVRKGTITVLMGRSNFSKRSNHGYSRSFRKWQDNIVPGHTGTAEI